MKANGEGAAVAGGGAPNENDGVVDAGAGVAAPKLTGAGAGFITAGRTVCYQMT